MPVLLFSFMCYFTLNNVNAGLGFKSSWSLFIGCWIGNELAYALYWYIKIYVLSFFFGYTPSNTEKFLEGLFFMPFAAMFFVGYYSVMVRCMQILTGSTLSRFPQTLTSHRSATLSPD